MTLSESLIVLDCLARGNNKWEFTDKDLDDYKTWIPTFEGLGVKVYGVDDLTTDRWNEMCSKNNVVFFIINHNEDVEVHRNIIYGVEDIVFYIAELEYNRSNVVLKFMCNSDKSLGGVPISVDEGFYLDANIRYLLGNKIGCVYGVKDKIYLDQVTAIFSSMMYTDMTLVDPSPGTIKMDRVLGSHGMTLCSTVGSDVAVVHPGVGDSRPNRVLGNPFRRRPSKLINNNTGIHLWFVIAVRSVSEQRRNIGMNIGASATGGNIGFNYESFYSYYKDRDIVTVLYIANGRGYNAHRTLGKHKGDHPVIVFSPVNRQGYMMTELETVDSPWTLMQESIPPGWF